MLVTLEELNCIMIIFTHLTSYHVGSHSNFSSTIDVKICMFVIIYCKIYFEEK
jgi:hypothetical protein